MIARSFAHSSPGCEPMGVILTFCANAGNATSKRANAGQAILMSFLLRSLVLVLAGRRATFGVSSAWALHVCPLATLRAGAESSGFAFHLRYKCQEPPRVVIHDLPQRLLARTRLLQLGYEEG